MNYRRLKPILAVGVLLITAFAFIYYFKTHPELIDQIKAIPPRLFLLILFLDFCVVASIGLVLLATIKLCNIPLKMGESLLVTMYSSIVNFFGPLQSGPAFRAVYFKKKHNLKIKDYTLATLAYYLFYAFFSGLFLVSGLLGWWLIALGLVGVFVILIVIRSNTTLIARLKRLNLRMLGFLGLATLLQVTLMSVVFFVELRSVDSTVSYGQALIYTGAANFALFVSITPGAIGFREAFLVFSEHLHNISYSTIVAANVIDRSMYIVMLLIIVVIIFGTHTSRKIKAVAEGKE